MEKNIDKNIDKERVLALLNEREKEVEKLELDTIISESGFFKSSLRNSWKYCVLEWIDEDKKNKEIWCGGERPKEFFSEMGYKLNRRKYFSGAEKDTIYYLTYMEWVCGLQEQELVDVVLVEKGKVIDDDDDGSHKVFYANVRLGKLLGIDFIKEIKKTSKWEKALENTPITLQKGMGLREALRLKELLEAAGAKVNLVHYKKAEVPDEI